MGGQHAKVEGSVGRRLVHTPCVLLQHRRQSSRGGRVPWVCEWELR